MCTTWIINGKHIECGKDLVAMFGQKKAEYLNERIVPHQSVDSWLESCLCHVERDRLKELTGTDYRYDADLDAMVPATPQGER